MFYARHIFIEKQNTLAHKNVFIKYFIIYRVVAQNINAGTSVTTCNIRLVKNVVNDFYFFPSNLTRNVSVDIYGIVDVVYKSME